MTEGHSPTADAPPAAATGDTAAAPVPVEVRGHANHHTESTGQPLKEKDSIERLTPRPTFMEHLADSREAQFHLNRQDSSELDRYFVCGPERRLGKVYS